jgi:hypothetical protein
MYEYIWYSYVYVYICLYIHMKIQIFIHIFTHIHIYRGLSIEYVKIMELLASHGHGAEYEKGIYINPCDYFNCVSIYT